MNLGHQCYSGSNFSIIYYIYYVYNSQELYYNPKPFINRQIKPFDTYENARRIRVEALLFFLQIYICSYLCIYLCIDAYLNLSLLLPFWPWPNGYISSTRIFNVNHSMPGSAEQVLDRLMHTDLNIHKYTHEYKKNRLGSNLLIQMLYYQTS